MADATLVSMLEYFAALPAVQRLPPFHREKLDEALTVAREQERAERDRPTCVVCGSQFLPMESIPHCLDCSPTDEQHDAWEARKR